VPKVRQRRHKSFPTPFTIRCPGELSAQCLC
jgi:hypothetical protein